MADLFSLDPIVLGATVGVLAVAGFVNKVLRGEGWEYDDFYRGIDLLLVATALGIVELSMVLRNPDRLGAGLVPTEVQLVLVVLGRIDK